MGSTMRIQQQSVASQVRRMLAHRLKMDESVLTDDFRWLALIDPVDEEEFLADVSDTFTLIPLGLSLGSGYFPFAKVEPNGLDRIATVGGLIAHIEQHIARHSDSR
jgi:hypothetical protein